MPELFYAKSLFDIDLEATFDEFGDVLRALTPLQLLKVKDVRVFLRDALVTDHLIRDESVQDGSQAPHVRQRRDLSRLLGDLRREEDTVASTYFIVEVRCFATVHKLHQGQVPDIELD